MKCTLMTESTYNSLAEYWNSTSFFFNILQIQYWGCFVFLLILQIVNTANRSRKTPFFSRKIFTYLVVAIKILFAPGIFIVTVIDYDRDCIYQTVGTFFLDFALYANIFVVLIIVIPIIFSFCGCDRDSIKTIVKNLAIIYIFCAIVAYIGLFFGPWLAKIENFIATFGLVVEGLETYNIERIRANEPSVTFTDIITN